MSKLDNFVTVGDSTRVICAVLRRETTHWNGVIGRQAILRFIEMGRYHGVLPLLSAAFSDRPDFESWPTEILLASREAALTGAMYDLAHRAEIIRVLDALSSAGITPLLLKGTALAYNVYPNPALRPRGDTDLLIPRDRRDETDRMLERRGYAKSEGIQGDFISCQATWVRSDRLGITHALDVHWRINNSQVLANSLSYDELEARAHPLPILGPNARALAPMDALLFACIHRAGHVNAPYYVDGVAHPGIDRLIWLYDIHLLVSRMRSAELDEFAALATTKKIKAICRDALVRTAECFATPIPAHVLKVLDCSGPVEPSAHYLTGSRTRIMVEDIRALEAWHDRLQWIKETAFPSARYMRLKYPDAAIAWLPILYTRRGLAGVARLFSPRDNADGH